MNQKIYLIVALATLASICSCSKRETPQTQESALHEEMPKASPSEVSNDSYILTLEEPANLEELKKLYKQYDSVGRRSRMTRKAQNEARMLFPGQDEIDKFILKSALDANLRVQAPLDILPCNKWEYIFTKINRHGIRQLISAFPHARNYKATDFFIRPLPPSTGLDYAITADSRDSDAEVGIGVNSDGTMRFAIIDPTASSWTKSWNLVRSGEGRYTIASTLVREYEHGEVVPYVWQSNHGSEDIRVNLEEERGEGQEFALRPRGDYKVIGIRFARTLSKLHTLLRTSNPNEKCEETYPDEEILYNGEYISPIIKNSTFTSTRTFTNTSSEEVPYDMYFDDERTIESSFRPFKTLDFNSLKNEQYVNTFTPIVRNDTLITEVSSKDRESNRFNMYPYTTQSRVKKLTGVLNLLVRPRSTVTISYTYTSYTVTTFFVAFLQKEQDPRIVYKVVGFWRGNVYAENAKNKHKFKSESLDPPHGSDGDDDDVDFEATTAEAIQRSQGRSSTSRRLSPAIPRDGKKGVRRIRI